MYAASLGVIEEVALLEVENTVDEELAYRVARGGTVADILHAGSYLIRFETEREAGVIGCLRQVDSIIHCQ